MCLLKLSSTNIAYLQITIFQMWKWSKLLSWQHCNTELSLNIIFALRYADVMPGEFAASISISYSRQHYERGRGVVSHLYTAHTRSYTQAHRHSAGVAWTAPHSAALSNVLLALAHKHTHTHNKVRTAVLECMAAFGCVASYRSHSERERETALKWQCN